MKTSTRQSLVAAVIYGSALTIGANALAHGTKAHGAKKAAAPVSKEQQAWGVAGDTARASRTVKVSMLDAMRFEPATVKVKQGETVRFLIKNTGQIMHEFVLGTPKALEKHAALMIKFPKMEHDEAHMAHVPPGKTGEIVWTFNRAGDFQFACLIPGHFQAGMKGEMSVQKSK